MSETVKILLYILVMAGVTYLVRAVPFVVFRKKIKNPFIRSFLGYIPYAVLAAMTIPAVFYATSNLTSAIIGVLVAIGMAFFEKGLVSVALCSCAAVYVVELLQKLL